MTTYNKSLAKEKLQKRDKYEPNKGRKEYAIRLGCEKDVYLFIFDYAQDMGMSLSGAVRRLVLIGAHCEANHARARMPISYENLRV